MLIDEIKNKVKIQKGWSDDKKYCASTSDGKRYLLRISKKEKFQKKKVQFEMMQKVQELDVPMCRALELGVCDEGVYSIQSWIHGEELEEVIDGFTSKEKYSYGFRAGEILRNIHSIKAPKTQEDWEVRFNRKIDMKIQLYEECEIEYDGGQAFIEYIEANRKILENRPQCYQHGDYHLGNMMIDNEGNLYIIDFDRDDFGDPWEEFNRIVWCAQKAPDFASGMVDGYFNGDVPLEFWKLLALYISSNTISSLPWAIKFGQNEIDTMINQAKEVLSWYDNMNNPIPTWYRNQGDIM